jgi:hypothetical protein
MFEVFKSSSIFMLLLIGTKNYFMIMNKEERKNLLERMIKANDLMSESATSQVLEYANCFIQLCTDLEYKHADALWKHEYAVENLEYTREQYYNYISKLKNEDRQNNSLYEIMRHQEKEAELLYEASRKGLQYFLGLGLESNETTLEFEV